VNFEIVVTYYKSIPCVHCKRDCVVSSISTESHIGRVVSISYSSNRVYYLSTISFSTDCHDVGIARESEVCEWVAVSDSEQEDLAVDS
jgi:hypothetical protein